MSAAAVIVAAVLALLPPVAPIPANIIDGADERAPLNQIAGDLGLSAAEVTRIRRVSGHVGCFEPAPIVGSGALYLTGDLILTAGHIFFQANGQPAGKCFFRAQAPGTEWIPLMADAANARFGARPPKPGSNHDWAIVRLGVPIADAAPFPLPSSRAGAGTPLVVISAQPAGFENTDPAMPIAQGCSVRRAPISSSSTNFYRTDCDASRGSSGAMNLVREDGELRFAGMTISTGPTDDAALRGAPYDEQAGSVTTVLATDAAILAAGRELAGR